MSRGLLIVHSAQPDTDQGSYTWVPWVRYYGFVYKNRIVHETQVRRLRGLTLDVGPGLSCSLFDLLKLKSI